MNLLLWKTFEIIINLYQGVLLSYFAYEFLQPKNMRPFWKSTGILCGVAIGGIITAVNCITMFEGLAIFIHVLVLFLYSLFALRGTLVQKLFASLAPFEISTIITILFINLFAAFFNVPLENILTNQSMGRFLLLVVIQTAMFFSFKVTLKYLKNDKCQLNQFEWRLIFTVLIISVFISVFLNLLSLYEHSYTLKLLITFSVCGIGLINIVVYYMVVNLSVKNSVMSENVVLKVKRDSQQESIDQMIKENEFARKLRHDYRGVLMVLHILIEENKLEAALRHIKENANALDGIETFATTKNDVVNAILNIKLTKAKRAGIKISLSVMADFYGIEAIDLSNLLGNILENAIAACEKCDKVEKVIIINIIEEGSKCIFNVKNSIEFSVLDNNPKLITTKREKDAHGYGTKIIKDISYKYNGTCDFYEEEHLFCCNVALTKMY